MTFFKHDRVGFEQEVKASINELMNADVNIHVGRKKCDRKG